MAEPLSRRVALRSEEEPATVRSGSAVANVYEGTRRSDGTTYVSVNGQPLDPRTESRKESATTLDWGYDGRGAPAQLALAILAHHFGDDERARRHYELLLHGVVQGLPRERWVLTSAEIDGVLPGGGY